MQKDHKTIIYIIITIISVMTVAIGTVLILSSINKKEDTKVDNTAVIKESADSLKLQAIQQMNSDGNKAKQLLLEAKAKYEQLGDQNALIDIEAQLYYIENNL